MNHVRSMRLRESETYHASCEMCGFLVAGKGDMIDRAREVVTEHLKTCPHVITTETTRVNRLTPPTHSRKE